MRQVTEDRCERGAEIARMLELPEESARTIYSLDEHWDGKGHPHGLAGEEIPILARIACLSQTTEVFLREFGELIVTAFRQQFAGDVTGLPPRY